MTRRLVLLLLAVTGCTANDGRKQSGLPAHVDEGSESVGRLRKKPNSGDAPSTLSSAERQLIGTYILGRGLPTYATLRLNDFGLYSESLGSCVGPATSDVGTWQLEEERIVLISAGKFGASLAEDRRWLTIRHVDQIPVLVDAEHVSAYSLEGPTATNCYQRLETNGSEYWANVMRPSAEALH